MLNIVLKKMYILRIQCIQPFSTFLFVVSAAGKKKRKQKKQEESLTAEELEEQKQKKVMSQSYVVLFNSLPVVLLKFCLVSVLNFSLGMGIFLLAKPNEKGKYSILNAVASNYCTIKWCIAKFCITNSAFEEFKIEIKKYLFALILIPF